MVEVLILPERRRIKVEREELTITEVLELLDIDELDSVAILINNRLITDPNYVVKRNDRVVLIKQATGG